MSWKSFGPFADAINAYNDDKPEDERDPDKFYPEPNRAKRRRPLAGRKQPLRSRMRRKLRKPRTGGWK